MPAIQQRYDFVLLIDVMDGNPNGDPDAGNLPRMDAETGQGLMTDVCIKRKVRNYVETVHGGEPPYAIYVKEKAVLNRTHEAAYRAVGREAELTNGKGSGRRGSAEAAAQAQQWLCANFYDIRTFGAVMGTGVNCGQVRGPVQLTFARSVDPVVVMEHAITRVAVATEAEAEQQQGDNRTMGRKHTVPYGLYVAHGFISAKLAGQTGFSEEDLALLWQAMTDMWTHDRAAARGMMATRGLYVFRHESALGNALAQDLFGRVQIKRTDDVSVARSYMDYKVEIDDVAMPTGVELLRMVG